MANHDKSLVYSRSVSWVEINDEVFVFDELNGGIHLFREVEREIWKLIDPEVPITFIVNSMQEHFNIEEKRTLKIIEKFQEKKLVKERFQQTHISHYSNGVEIITTTRKLLK